MHTLDPRPEHGIRIRLDSQNEDGPPWIYEGWANTKQRDFRLRAVIEVDGHIRIESPDGMPTDLVIKVRGMIAGAVDNKEVASERPSQIRRWSSLPPW